MSLMTEINSLSWARNILYDIVDENLFKNNYSHVVQYCNNNASISGLTKIKSVIKAANCMDSAVSRLYLPLS